MEVEHTTEVAIDTDKITKEEKESITPSSFPINIKCINSDGTINGLDNIRIEVKRTDLIAAVKQKYIDTGKCTSPDYIVFQYNGKELSWRMIFAKTVLFSTSTRTLIPSRRSIMEN